MTDDLRRLNSEFAEKVLGWTFVEDDVTPWPFWVDKDRKVVHEGRTIKLDLTAAWAGVEVVKKQSWHISLEDAGTTATEDYWVVSLWKGNNFDKATEHVVGQGPTPAEALCRALLEAVKDK